MDAILDAARARAGDDTFLKAIACLDAHDVMAALKISAPTLTRMVKDGDFPAPIRVAGGLPRWPVETVREWFESRPRVSKPRPYRRRNAVA